MINGHLFKNKHTIYVYWKGVRRYTEENGENILEKAGIYEILVKLKNKDEYKRKYVGQADDLHKRYMEHLSDGEENEDIYNV